MKVLVQFAHPALAKSRVNRRLVEGLDSIEGVTFNDLYQAYPEFYIDVEREQALMEAHDVIIFQFPFFWYSTPALLKEWQDLVLQHGWAFGREGTALKDKLFLCSITVGGPRKAYQVGDFHDYTLNMLLAPLKQTAKLCKMRFLPPFAAHGAHGLKDQEIGNYRSELHQLIRSMVDEHFDVSKAEGFEYMNDYLEQQTAHHGR